MENSLSDSTSPFNAKYSKSLNFVSPSYNVWMSVCLVLISVAVAVVLHLVVKDSSVVVLLQLLSLPGKVFADSGQLTFDLVEADWLMRMRKGRLEGDQWVLEHILKCKYNVLL